MKNITKSIIALFAILALSCSVEDVQDRPVIVGTDAPVLTAPLSGATYVLLFDNASAQVERFTWKSANYAGDIQVTYAVEIDKKGNAFATPQTLGSVISGNQVSVTVEQMNNALKALKATPLAAAQFEIRVKSTSGATAPMFSNVNTITVTPYSTEIPKLAVPGDHQGANWNPATAPLLAATKFGNTDFEGYVWLEGKFKFVASDAAGAFAWGNTDYGDDGTFSGVLKAENESDCSTTAGYYRVNADTKALTYSTVKTVWGVIGSASPGSWDNSTVMTYSPTTKKWTVTVALTAGGNEIKFRANNAWAVELGGFDAAKPGVGTEMSYGGKNIAVASAGTYVVTLDLSNPRAYTYSLVKQ
jgi:hypothetical protein